MKSILFDLDGTLVDSSIGIKNSFAYAFDKLGLPCPKPEILRTFIGPPLEDSFTPYVSDVNLAVKTYREYYKKNGVFEVELYPDIEQLLKDLVANNYKLYITSSKNEPMIHVMLKHLKIDKYFTGIYGHTPKQLNKTEVIKACLSSEPMAANDTMIIGDTKFDIIGGKNNNIKTIGVTWGFGLESELLSAGADNICFSPSEIIKAIETV